MKKAVRDILLIAALFGAIVLTPLLIRNFSNSDEPDAKAPPVAQERAKAEQPAAAVPANASDPAPAAATDMPPQPKSLDAVAPGETAIQALSDIDMPKPVESTLNVPPMDSKNCPAIDLSTEHNYDPFIELRRLVQPLIIRDADVGQMMLKGGNGVDTLKVPDGGTFDIEGVHVHSIEVYDIRNGQPNAVRIFAAGLVTMNGRHAMIRGDKQGDTVYLDPCLQWNDPIAIEDGPEPLLRYDAHDAQGNQASVSVSDGVQVVKGK